MIISSVSVQVLYPHLENPADLFSELQPGEIFLVFLCVPLQTYHASPCTADSLSLSLIWAAVSITLSRFILMIKATEKGGASTKSTTMATTTILWRNNSGHWSRMSDLIELKAAP